jgi:hypothetical protein
MKAKALADVDPGTDFERALPTVYTVYIPPAARNGAPAYR